MKKNELIVKLNGKTYLLFHIPIVSQDIAESTVEKIHKYDGILQGVTDLHKAGIFRNGHCILNVLIPEENIMEFNKPTEPEESREAHSPADSFLTKFNALGEFAYKRCRKLIGKLDTDT